jgi:hypothetical protein
MRRIVLISTRHARVGLRATCRKSHHFLLERDEERYVGSLYQGVNESCEAFMRHFNEDMAWKLPVPQNYASDAHTVYTITLIVNKTH